MGILKTYESLTFLNMSFGIWTNLWKHITIFNESSQLVTNLFKRITTFNKSSWLLLNLWKPTIIGLLDILQTYENLLQQINESFGILNLWKLITTFNCLSHVRHGVSESIYVAWGNVWNCPTLKGFWRFNYAIWIGSLY